MHFHCSRNNIPLCDILKRLYWSKNWCNCKEPGQWTSVQLGITADSTFKTHSWQNLFAVFPGRVRRGFNEGYVPEHGTALSQFTAFHQDVQYWYEFWYATLNCHARSMCTVLHVHPPMSSAFPNGASIAFKGLFLFHSTLSYCCRE